MWDRPKLDKPIRLDCGCLLQKDGNIAVFKDCPEHKHLLEFTFSRVSTMSLSKEENAIASRIFLEITRNINEGVKLAAQSVEHYSERHTKDGRVALLNAQAHFRRLQVNLEDLRKTLNLQDPAEARRGELTERYIKARGDLDKILTKQARMKSEGEDDPNLIQAVDQLVVKYRNSLNLVKQEMEMDGWSTADIASLDHQAQNTAAGV